MSLSSPQRLSKVLAEAGVASRREAEKMIQEGRVSVNGDTILLPQFRVELGKDTITLDGSAITRAEKKVYFLLNKPPGYVCSSRRFGKEKLAIDLLEHTPERLFTVGRLDKESEGLILATNDGQFAQKVSHPSTGIKKEYVVTTDAEITHDHLAALSKGCRLDGDWVRPVKVAKVRRGTLRIVITEGKNHEVRRLLAHVGLEVRQLKRTRIGGLTLGNLPLGGVRSLTLKELDQIYPQDPAL